MMANKLLLSFLALTLYNGTFFHTKSAVKHINAAAASDQICGKWQNEAKNLIVQVYKEDDEFRAKIVWFNNGEGEQSMNNFRDKHNPDPGLRNRKVIGMNVLDDLEYVADTNSWENGSIYDASSGRTYNSCARLDKDGKLLVKGYWHFKFIGKTIKFARCN